MNKLIWKYTLALLTIILTCVCANAQTLSPEEQKIASFIDAHHFMSELQTLGLTAKWIDMPAEMKRAGHLLAQTSGTKGKRLLLLGHIDTVLSGEKFRREGNRAFGTGTADMKAGAVVLLYALKALEAAGALKDTRIVVMLTGDEETAGRPVDGGTTWFE